MAVNESFVDYDRLMGNREALFMQYGSYHKEGGVICMSGASGGVQGLRGSGKKGVKLKTQTDTPGRSGKV